jgi:hypothetical protein
MTHSRASPILSRTALARSNGWNEWRRRAGSLAPRVLLGAALVLAGAVTGLAAGQAMATRPAHQAGACAALSMAAALGYLDAEQQRRVRNALVSAINPDADLFAGLGPSAPATCASAI